MKKNSLILMLLAAVMMTSSCKKEKVVDARDQFVGSWSGNGNFTIPDLQINYSDVSAQTITKNSSNSNQINISDASESHVASVNGNSYTYSEYTATVEDPTLGTMVWIINGIGTINGSNILESGTVRTVIQGSTYYGTWTSNMVKQ